MSIKKLNHFENIFILLIASIMMYMSPLILHDDPIIIVGYFIVYLELSKILYTVTTGIDAPILIRYVFAALTVGSAIKVYQYMIEFDPIRILVFSLVSGFFLFLRHYATTNTVHN